MKKILLTILILFFPIILFGNVRGLRPIDGEYSWTVDGTLTITTLNATVVNGTITGNISADNIDSGTLATARLDSDVVTQNYTNDVTINATLVIPTLNATGEIQINGTDLFDTENTFTVTQNIPNLLLGSLNVVPDLGIFTVDGTVSNITGPHTAFFISGDNDYPVFQQLNWAHDNIAFNFDAYYDGTSYKSSDNGSNFLLSKNTDLLRIQYDSGITAGDNITWNTGFQINTAGNITKPNNVEFNTFRSFNANNYLGGNAYYTMPYSSERIDNQDRFHGTGYYFSAPVTGRYLFTFSCAMSGFDSTNTDLIMRLRTSNKNYHVHRENPWLNRSATGNFIRSGTVYADLDAADTALVEIYVSGNKVIEVVGEANGELTWFTGCLIQ